MKINYLGFKNGEPEEKGEKDFDLKKYISIPLEKMTSKDYEDYKKHKQERNARILKKMEREER